MTELDFVTLHRENLNPVFRYLARRVELSEAENLVSEVFSIAWTKRQKCPTGYELPWLLRIASLLVKNHRRKMRSQPTLLELNPDISTNSGRTQAPGSSLGSSGHVPGADSDTLSERLVSSWNQLSPGEREVLALVAFEGLDAKSLAKSLGTSVNGATIRLSRARKKLGNLMKEFDQR